MTSEQPPNLKVSDPENTKNLANENPFLIMGFLEFAIISTLMVAFFPWSLLFCLFFYGMDFTKLLIAALLHDWIKTILAVLSVVIPLVIIAIVLFVWLVSSR
jgi:hypothetical protein